MAWRIIEVSDDEALGTDLTNSELVGVSILLTHHCGIPRNDLNVYWRASNKLREVAKEANWQGEQP
jgi:hypothetical protein